MLKEQNIAFEYPIKKASALTVESLLKTLLTDKDKGISDAEASKRSAKFGLNIYKSQKQKSIWQMVLEQFNSPIVYLLFLEAFASLYFKNNIEAITIFMVILINFNMKKIIYCFLICLFTFSGLFHLSMGSKLYVN